MRINKDQKDGLAKVADNLATASAGSLIVARLIEQKIGWGVTALLVGSVGSAAKGRTPQRL